jgi:GT2 family glycosyltransferase
MGASCARTVASAVVDLAPMTVTVASYQRRDSLLRLLRALDEQFAASAELARDVSVVVVLDGSTDGSREAVEAERWRVPVRVHWQPNRGLAATRNVGLAAAEGGIVWFLDDDLVPSPGLVARHRRAHSVDAPAVVVGPCRIPPDVSAPAALVRWWDAFYEELESTRRIDRFDLFTTANASAPAELFTAVGGFDERFVEYGLEDYELAVRLLAAGTTLRFDREAVAWHPDIPPMRVLVRRQQSLGRNAARLAQLHPKTREVLFPRRERVTAPRRLLRKLRLRSPWSLMAVSRAAFALSQATRSLHVDTSRRAEHLARAAAQAAGVAASDPDGTLLDLLLGYPADRASGSRSRRRASRQPMASPTSNDHTISR